MTFHKFIAAGVRKSSGFRKKGRSDGLMTGKRFDKFIRQPFRDKVVQQAANRSAPRRGYDAFDHGQFETARRRTAVASNYAQLPAVHARQELKRTKSLPRSPSRAGHRQIGW